MLAHELATFAAGHRRQPLPVRLALLAVLGLLPLGSRRICGLLARALRLLPKHLSAQGLGQGLRLLLLQWVPKAWLKNDPFVRLAGGLEAFQRRYELTELVADARNSGFVHACRARGRSDTDARLVVKMVPRSQHPLLVPRSRGAPRKLTSRRPSKSKPGEETEDFRQYMRTLLKLRHENVVRYMRFFSDETSYYFVMERCPGVPLQDYVVGHSFWDEAAVRPLQRQLLQALSYIHHMGIVHRDVKMENAVVSPEGCLKLLDFGLGCDFFENKARGEVGTVGYTAPEVFSRSPYGPGIDLFSAGAVLHILLSGRPPFRACDRVEERVQLILEGAALEAPAFKLVSPAGINLLERLLEPWPHRRPTAVGALGHAWFRSEGSTCSGPTLWNAAESEVEFLQVIGVWEGSKSGSTVGVPSLLARIAEEESWPIPRVASACRR